GKTPGSGLSRTVQITCPYLCNLICLSTLLRKHRGLTAEHAMKAIGWLLYFKTEHPADPWTLMTSDHWQPTNKTTAQQYQPERIGPALYDTAFSYQDGNGIQQGWGGRSR